MTTKLLDDAFAHHVWATLRLIDVCGTLTPEQLQATVPGTYGSIIDTLRHLVDGDASYLFVLTAQRTPMEDLEGASLDELRTAMARHGAEWSSVLAKDLDPGAVLVRRREDGSETSAPLGIRLAQALHHGTDHRSQVCTALTTLGVEPPYIDAWDFGLEDGRVVEVPPSS